MQNLTKNQIERSFFTSILQMGFSMLSNYTSHYYKLRPPLDLFPALYDFQMEIGPGQTVIVPSMTIVTGILGIGEMMLTNCVYNGKLFHKVEHEANNMYDCSLPMINVVSTLSCITKFNFANSGLLNSRHLEQLAIACPIASMS